MIALSTGIALVVLALVLHLVVGNPPGVSTPIPAEAPASPVAAPPTRWAGAESADTESSVVAIADAADARRRPVTGAAVGSARLPGGSPAPLYVFCEPVDDPPLIVTFRQTTDRDGSFRFDRLLPGRYRVLAALSPVAGYRYSNEFAIEAGQTAELPPIVMAPEPIGRTGAEPPALTGSLRLRGRDAEAGALRPLLGVTRVLAFDDLGHASASVTDPRGNFAFYGLAPGTYTILVGHPEYRAATGNRVATGQHGVEVVVDSGSSGITGSCRDQSGAPLPRFRIAILERHAEQTFLRGHATGFRGSYGIQKLAPGTWDLRFEADGCEPHVERIALEGPDYERVDVSLRRRAR